MLMGYALPADEAEGRAGVEIAFRIGEDLKHSRIAAELGEGARLHVGVIGVDELAAFAGDVQHSELRILRRLLDIRIAAG